MKRHRLYRRVLQSQIRLYVDPPYQDETWTSFLDRTAVHYGVNRQTLVSLLDNDPDSDFVSAVDAAPSAAIYRGLLGALGVEAESLPHVSRGIQLGSVCARQRADYCPLCFLNDLDHRRTPYFRFQWAIPLRVACHIHGTPLRRWRHVRNEVEMVLPSEWALDPRPKHARKYYRLEKDLRLASEFASMEDGDSPWDLAKRLGEETITIDPSGLSWNFTSPDRNLIVTAVQALQMGAFKWQWDVPALADELRPAGRYRRLFAKSSDVDSRGPMKITRLLKYYSWGWRASLIFFAARFLYTSSLHELANGERAPAGDPSVWINFVVRTGRGWQLRGWKSSSRFAAVRRLGHLSALDLQLALKERGLAPPALGSGQNLQPFAGCAVISRATAVNN